MGDIDVGDFNKARSFLIAWSCLVIALWFFEADLASFKLLGNEISLKRNQEHVWLMMAFVNLYLLLRYLQRLPSGFLKFSAEMDLLYNRVLCWEARTRYRWDLKKAAPGDGDKVEYLKTDATIYYSKQGDNSPSRLSREDRTRVELQHLKRITSFKGDSKEQWGHGGWAVPTATRAYAAKVLAVIVGAFTVPWLTDFIAPIALGLASTITAVYIWY